MPKTLTMGSLFDGAGTMPFAGTFCNIKTLWSSEVDCFPRIVEKSRFPDVVQMGDVTKIDGAKVPPVDILVGGFPCQSVSVAGKRAGVKHEDQGDEITTRSGLVYDFTRIAKEMRDEDERNGRRGVDVRCRWLVAENVPGLLSSAKGEDFRRILEDICKVKDPDAVVPRPPKGKWAVDGCIVGDGYSVAWRMLNATPYVPQRRRRVYLVADFGGECAGEILFKPEGLPWNYTEVRSTFQSLAPAFKASSHPTDREV